MSNRVQRKSVFRKRLGRGGGGGGGGRVGGVGSVFWWGLESGVVARPPFHTKNIRSPTRIFISRSFRSSCNVKGRYRKLATKFSSFTKLCKSENRIGE